MTRKNFFENLGLTPSDQSQFGLVLSSVQGDFGKPPTTLNSETDPFASATKFDKDMLTLKRKGVVCRF